jgi:chromosome segregation protein
LEERTSQFLADVKREGETQNLVTRSQTLYGSVERDLERLGDESLLLEEEDTPLRSHEQELREKLAGTKEARSGAQEALTPCRTARAGTDEDLERTEQELHQAREDLSQSSSRLASLTELERSLGGWPERLRKELDRLQQHSEIRGEVRGLVAGCVQVSPEHETALEAVLGEKLKYLLVNSLETAVGAGRCMQKDSSVRGTFLPLSPRARSGNGRPEGPGILGEVQDFVSVSEEYRQVIRHLLHGVILVRDLDAAHTLWTSGDGSWTFVTPTGEVLWPDGSVSAGRIDPSLELLPLLRKIRETKTTVAAAGERVEELSRSRSELKKRLGELEDEEKRLRETGYRLDNDISSLEKDLSLTRQKSHSLSLQRQKLEEASRKAAAEKEGLAEKLTQELARKSEFEFGRDRREKDIAGREKKLSEVLAEEASLTERANSLQVELAGGRERSSHLRARRERLASEQLAAESRRDEQVREQAALREQERLETNEVGNLTGEREDLAGSREALERRLTDAQEEQQQKSGRVREMEETLRRLRLKAEEVQREITALQVQEAETHVRLEHLQDKVAETDRCAPEKLWDQETREAVRQLPPEDLNREHRDLASRLQALGPVNLAAIGDHQELQERLNFLIGQREDLEKASEDLHQAIRKINRTTRQRFVETFEKINEKFQEVFPVLFEGGQGTLRLTETEDPLEAGIEVLAQPAGKKLQQLSLLSGGEKALASMALLLAIFMVKPTPFCLLDEVDAPLDETNTGRFLTLLNKSINGSQLVVITHNKRTMENAGHLIGVAMTDPGVSTLISMRLRDQ